jgi:hypothetical protein
VVLVSDVYGMSTLDEPPAVERVKLSAKQEARSHAFGASDIASLFVGYGLRDPAVLGDKARKNGHRFARGRWKLPRVVLEKAGAVQPLAYPEDVVNAGRDRERELALQWMKMVERGTAGPDAEYVVGPIRYVPDEPFPAVYIDAVEFRLRVSPDVCAFDSLFGQRTTWDTKCSVHPYADKRGGVPLEHVIQLNAQWAAMDFGGGGIVEGVGWSAVWKARNGEAPPGPVRTWAVSRDERLIAEIRQVVGHAWADVVRVRAEMEET